MAKVTKKNTEKVEKVEKMKPTMTKQVMVGRVVSAKLAMTVTVLVNRQKKHPLYHKSILQSEKFLVHDLIGAKLGDMVEVVKVKPISRHKHFQVLRVIGQDMAAVAAEHLKKDVASAIAEVMPEEVKEEVVVEEVVKEEVKPTEKKTSEKKVTKKTKKEAKA